MNRSTSSDRLQLEPALDAVSAVLDGLHAQCIVRRATGGCDPWSLEVVQGPATFAALESGRVRFRTATGTIEAGPGDVVVFPGAMPRTGESEVHAGLGARMLLGSLVLGEHKFQLLRELLPEALLLAGAHGHFAPGLEEALAILRRECAGTRSGAGGMREHAARIVFLHAVRACVEGSEDLRSNRLRALTSPALGAVLGEMHRRPDLPWTVQMMARRAGLSRTVFAARFRASLGATPVRYLLECRMQRAAELLQAEHASLKEIADRVGYGTEAAFSHAFKRWSGHAPKAWRAQPSGQRAQ